MIRVPRVKVKEGMVLAQPVLHPDRPGQVLLNTGFTLTCAIVEKLESLGIVEIWIEFPGTAFLEEQVNPKISRLQNETCQALQQGIDSIASGAEFVIDYEALHGTIRDLIHEIVMTPNALALMQELNFSNTVMLQHSINVMLMSLLLGLRLDGYLIQQRSRLTPSNAKKVTSLGVGALLHDIGLLRIEPDVLEKWCATGDDTDPAWRAHVTEGYELVKSTVDATAANAVLHHHQMVDGSGFPDVKKHKDDDPKPMSGAQIHVFCRILAVANRFDRLRNPTDGSSVVPRVAVLHRMLFDETESRKFDLTVLRSLIDVTPPFEVGKVVTLSDSREAVVTHVRMDEPCKPTVAPMRSDGKGVGEAFDLRERTGLEIAKVDGVSVSQWLFSGDALRTLDARIVESTSPNAASSEQYIENWAA